MSKYTDEVHNIIVIGSGCAGYACCLYSARAKLNPLLFEGTYENNYTPGGQLTTTSIVENYVGFKKVEGGKLIDLMKEHAEEYEMKSLYKSVKSLDLTSFPYKVYDFEGNEYKTKSIVIATGATAKKLEFNNSEKYKHQLSQCFTCDGSLPCFRNKPIIVVGAGDSAFEASLYLSRFGSKIYIVHRSEKFRASKIMIDRVKKNPKIEIITNTVVVDVHGNEKLERVEVQDVNTKEKRFMDASGVFMMIGHKVNTDFIKNTGIELDDEGYIITSGKSTKSNIGGVFGAGDCADNTYKQAIIAAGEGVKASMDAEQWLMNCE